MSNQNIATLTKQNKNIMDDYCCVEKMDNFCKTFKNNFSIAKTNHIHIYALTVNILDKTYLYYDYQVKDKIKDKIKSFLLEANIFFGKEIIFTSVDEQKYIAFFSSEDTFAEENKIFLNNYFDFLSSKINFIEILHNGKKIHFQGELKLIIKTIPSSQENEQKIEIQNIFSHLLFFSETQMLKENQMLFVDHEKNGILEQKIKLEKELLKIFDSNTFEKNLEKIEIEKIEKNIFFMFQPQFDLQTLEMTGAELLVRWNYHGETILSPEMFLQKIKRINKTKELTLYALRTICNFLKKHPSFKKTIYFNLYPSDLNNTLFIKKIQDCIKQYDIDPISIGIEILEDEMISNIENTITSLNTLHDMGVKIAIDDFGEGYFSLKHLEQLPVDCIKIDKYLLKNIEKKQNQIILKTIIDFAKSINTKTIIEGIENIRLLALAKNSGGNYGQGYFFSKPIREKDFEQIVLRENDTY